MNKSEHSQVKRVLVTGGAGYVGSVLVPKLLKQNIHVRVLDWYLYGDNVLSCVKDHPCLEEVKGDIRNPETVRQCLTGCDAVIHLACISNDPSFDLDAKLGKSVNYDAFILLLNEAKKQSVRRFVFASSSSVYGIKEEDNVTEELHVHPLTDYSKYKSLCEDILLNQHQSDFEAVIFRPATVCGYSPRLRLDLTVNILTNHAVNNRKITVFGGEQRRPNIHIEDMTDLYVQSLQWPKEKINGKVFNVGYQNHRVREIAEMVQQVVGDDIEIITTPTDDNRSYHISSEKIERELGFVPKHTIQDAIQDLVEAFHAGKIPNAMTDSVYYNIKTMQEKNIT